MQLTIFSIFTVFALVLSALAAPVELVRRAPPNLEISLRETGKNKAEWHFALVIHAAGTSFTGAHVPVHEYVLWEKTGKLVYDDSRKAPTTNAQLSVTAKLIPAGHETTDQALEDAVKKLIATTASADPKDPNYVNCFDYAVNAVHALEAKGYVSAADYKKFTDYHQKEVGGKPYHEIVRGKTAPPLRTKLGFK